MLALHLMFERYEFKRAELNGRQKLSGSVCAYHSADLGSNPKLNINACSICIVVFDITYIFCNWLVKRTKINKKRPVLAHS